MALRTRVGAGLVGILVAVGALAAQAQDVGELFRNINPSVVGARVIESEPAADLSLLQLERVPTGAKVARLGDSDNVRVGDQVVVVGAPYGLSYSLSVGWISAKWPPNTVHRAMPLAEFFQTNATINTGNSGGPMFTMAGEVVGIVSHIISKSGGRE